MKFRMPQEHTWPAVAALVIVAVFGLWWVGASRGISSVSDMAGATSTTPNTTSESATSTTVAAQQTRTASSDVLSVARSISGSSQFMAYLSSTGVASSIGTGGQYTIFVPRDTAFGKLSKGTITNLSSAEKKRLVQYHIVSGRAIDPDVILSGNVESLSRDVLNFTVNKDGSSSVGTAKIVASYKAKNGYVYVIDNVLIPPKK